MEKGQHEKDSEKLDWVLVRYCNATIYAVSK